MPFLLATVVRSLFFLGVQLDSHSHRRRGCSIRSGLSAALFYLASRTHPTESRCFQSCGQCVQPSFHEFPNFARCGTGAQSCRRISLRRELSKMVRYSRQYAIAMSSWSSTPNLPCPPRFPLRMSFGLAIALGAIEDCSCARQGECDRII